MIGEKKSKKIFTGRPLGISVNNILSFKVKVTLKISTQRNPAIVAPEGVSAALGYGLLRERS